MAPKNFHHPYTPYSIQQDFMEAVYTCIETRSVGIFESPTGTGKSLSLICASLTWLREHKRRKFDEALASVEIDDGEPKWMAEYARTARSREIRVMREEFERRLGEVRERERRVRERAAAAEGERRVKRVKLERKAVTDAKEDEEQFVLDDYESGDERVATGGHEYGAETAKLMEKMGMLPKDGPDRTLDDGIEETKVFFCSRTHSQLSQFVGELRRVRLPPGLPPEANVDLADGQEPVEELKHLTLGSRKNLCINPAVSKLPTQTAVNERCIELQQTKTPADKKCPFLPNKQSEDLTLDFRDHALASLKDIEDLAKLGARLQICPYYASRPAIAPAEIVTLPYPLLLQKTAREALGISLKGHVVIIDEAHNLMNAVEGIYSAQISDAQLQRAKEGLVGYLQKFRNRLKGSNRTYVTQVVRIIDSLLQFASTVRDSPSNAGPIAPSALLAGKAVDQINLLKLVRYITESKLARKVEGYAAHVAQKTETPKAKKQSSTESTTSPDVPTLMQVQSFLLTLMNPAKEGRFLWSRDETSSTKITIQYLLLDPSAHFREVVSEARSVILAGGTMSPMEDYTTQLFPYLPSVTTFSCGHLIPPSNLFVRSITADATGPLTYTYAARNHASALRLGHALVRLAAPVVGGMVVFLPSYAYMESLLAIWRSSSPSILAQLETLKPVYHDSRTTSSEETFATYTAAITTNPDRGALLLSVLGGKLSEGINFADALGRCVVVVGLPYPNLETAGWKAKLQYLDERAGDVKAGREHAENVCMRSVNQAIGRVIRHRADWASILLLDARYAQRRVWGKLPAWIREGAGDDREGRVAEVVGELGNFFTGKDAS